MKRKDLMDLRGKLIHVRVMNVYEYFKQKDLPTTIMNVNCEIMETGDHVNFELEVEDDTT